MARYIILFTLVFSFSCKGQTNFKESEDIANAKWYYYSYAIDLKGYDKSGEEVQPLACGIIFLKSLKISADTTKIFFQVFSKDTLNVCSFRPLNLVGITVVRNKLYCPIYHTIVFDSEKDETILEKMSKQSLLLQRKVLENSKAVNPWLQSEVKRRKTP